MHCTRAVTVLKTVARLAQLAQKLVPKEASCIEIEVIIRDFESGPRAGVFADDGAFASKFWLHSGWQAGY